ncbi:MAG: hypothetical protein U9Q83_12145 [Bacteroidota bacterium]|nr:hypothetical protein [Bacteroidota bacterium]
MIITKLKYNLFFSIIILFSFYSFSQNKIDYYSYLIESQTTLLNKNYDSTVLLLSRAIELNPNSSTSNYTLAKLYYKQNQNVLALNYAQNALNIDTANYWYKYLLFNIYKSLHNKTYTKFYLTSILTSTSNQNDYYMALNYADSINDHSSYVNYLELYKTKFGEDEFYFITKVIYYESISDSSSIFYALDYYNNFPYSQLSLQILINTFNTFQYLDSIKKYTQIYLSLYEADFHINLQISRYFNEKFLLLNNISHVDSSLYYFNLALKSRDYSLPPIINYLENSIDIYNPFVLNSDYDSIAIHLSKKFEYSDYLYDYLANTYLHYNRFYDALNYFQLYLSNNFSNFTTYFKTYALLNRLQYWSELDSLTNISLNLFPLAPEVYLFRGIALLNLNYYDEAINNIEYGIAITFENDFLLAHLKFYKSEYYRLVNDSINSQTYLDKAVELSKNSPDVLANFALYYAKSNVCLDNALDLISFCVTSNPNDLSPTISYTYAYILYQIADYANALNYVNYAIDNTLYPNFLYIYLKAKILKSSGRINESKKIFKKSYEYGNNPSKY